MEEAHPFNALKSKLTVGDKELSYFSLTGLKDDRVGKAFIYQRKTPLLHPCAP